jgi:hypothetical protein
MAEVPSRLLIAPDGSLLARVVGDHIDLINGATLTADSEVGIDPTATDSDVALCGAPLRLVVIARHDGTTRIHAVDPRGPTATGELTIKATMRLVATAGDHLWLAGPSGSAVLDVVRKELVRGAAAAHAGARRRHVRGQPVRRVDRRHARGVGPDHAGAGAAVPAGPAGPRALGRRRHAPGVDGGQQRARSHRRDPAGQPRPAAADRRARADRAHRERAHRRAAGGGRRERHRVAGRSVGPRAGGADRGRGRRRRGLVRRPHQRRDRAARRRRRGAAASRPRARGPADAPPRVAVPVAAADAVPTPVAAVGDPNVADRLSAWRERMRAAAPRAEASGPTFVAPPSPPGWRDHVAAWARASPRAPRQSRRRSSPAR